jgi:hypothetical protein
MGPNMHNVDFTVPAIGGLRAPPLLRRGRDALRARTCDCHSSDGGAKHQRRLLALSGLILITLLIAGCGGSGTPAVAHANASTTGTALATPLSTTPTTSASTTSASTSTGPPEAIFYQNESDSGQLAAMSGAPGGLSVTPLASFSEESSDESPGLDIYTFSPDLSKQAAIATTSDGSKVAGYIPAGGGSFVNLSGHDSNGYSDAPVTDEAPQFNPASGELWWTSGKHVWSAAVSGGSPQDHGVGSFVAFNASGEPVASSLATSPDGTLTAIEDNPMAIEDNGAQNSTFVIGKSSVLTPSCQQPASTGKPTEFPALALNAEAIVRKCPGSASVTFAENTKPSCQSFIGFVSDSAFVCQTYEANSRSFDLLTFKIEGNKVKVLHEASLAPPTQMDLHESAVAPDGKTLWYVGVRNASATNPTEQTNLYVIPTNTLTPEPSPVSLTPQTAITGYDHLIGWRWHGHLLPAMTSGN